MGLVGLMLAGVFAATMSTADSQILACSAAVTQDLFPQYKGSTRVAKAATLAVALLALLLALSAKQGVFDLVLMAWGILGSTLGPLVILRVLGQVPPGWVAGLMMASGAATVVLFRPLSGAVYEVMPGMIVPLVVYVIVRPLSVRRA
jgi:sodium/proline symporter